MGLLQTGLSRLVLHTGGGVGLLQTGLLRLVLFILSVEKGQTNFGGKVATNVDGWLGTQPSR